MYSPALCCIDRTGSQQNQSLVAIGRFSNTKLFQGLSLSMQQGGDVPVLIPIGYPPRGRPTSSPGRPHLFPDVFGSRTLRDTTCGLVAPHRRHGIVQRHGVTGPMWPLSFKPVAGCFVQPTAGDAHGAYAGSLLRVEELGPLTSSPTWAVSFLFLMRTAADRDAVAVSCRPRPVPRHTAARTTCRCETARQPPRSAE
jgi:hypothetical protein